MRQVPELKKALQQPAAQAYLFICMFSLAIVLLVQLSKGHVMLNAFIFIVGVLGLIARYQSAPIVLLVVLSFGEFLHSEFAIRFSRRRPTIDFSLVDAIQCMALLCYIICQYRLFAITANVFPRDPRLREIPKDKKRMPYKRRLKLAYQRTVRGISGVELSLVFLSAAMFGVLSQVFWIWLSIPRNVLYLSWRTRREEITSLLVCWVAFLALVFFSVILRIWRWYSISPEEAKLYLQDTYWKETRREQRRQYRHLVHHRPAEQQRKAQS